MITKSEVETAIREVERQNGPLRANSVERANVNEKQLVVLLDAAKELLYGSDDE